MRTILILGMLPFFLFATHPEEDHSSNSMVFIGKIVNFLILFGGLIFLLRKPLKKFLAGRAHDIENQLEEVRGSRLEAGRKLQDAGTRLEKIADEVEKIKKEAEEEGLHEKKNIIDAARLESERLKVLTRQEIEMLTRASIIELKRYTAELATSLASERIQKKITQAGQFALIDKSIGKLEKLYEKPDSGKNVRARAH